MANEGEFPKSDGDILYGSEVNNFFDKFAVLYTSTGFDTTSGGTASATVELTAVSDIKGDYVAISITGTAVANHGGVAAGGGGNVVLSVEIKETGQAYSNVVANQTIHRVFASNNSPTIEGTQTSTFRVVSELTAGMKTNGFQVRVGSISAAESANGSASFTNRQTCVEFI